MEAASARTTKGAVIPRTSSPARSPGEPRLQRRLRPFVSANPFLRFRFRGRPWERRLVARWVDSRGETRSDQVVIAGAAA